MKHYIDKDKQIHGIGEAGDIDGDQSFLVQDSWTLLTDEEFQAAITPAPIQITSITKIQAMRQLKSMNLWANLQTILASNADANDEWTLALSLEFSDPFTAEIGTALGIADMQTVFNEASLL